MPVMVIIMLLAFFGNAEAGELWTKYELPASISCITGDSNYLWIGTTEKKIIRLNRSDWSQTVYTSTTDSIGDKVQYIAVDSSGRVFAGAGNDGYYLTGWLSMFENNSWKPFHTDKDGLLGIDLKGIKVDKNNKVWTAVNNSYFEEIDGIKYCVYKQAIQYYNSEESTWKSLYTTFQKIKAEGNWGMHITAIRKNIRCFDIADSSYFVYDQEGEYYDYLIFQNGWSGVNIDDTHRLGSTNNVIIEQRADNNKILYVDASFSDLERRIVYGESDKILNRNVWSVLTIPIPNLSFTDTHFIIDKNNNKWFAFYDKISINVCLIKYDDLNFSAYYNPFFVHGFNITCLYEDDQGYIWIGTQTDGLWRFDAKNTTAVETAKQTPATFTLTGAYPNPFNASTTISFTLNQPGKVNLAVYSLTGQKVRELEAGNYSAGSHTVVWDGKDDSGNAVSSGVYLARMESGGNSKVVRMAMVK